MQGRHLFHLSWILLIATSAFICIQGEAKDTKRFSPTKNLSPKRRLSPPPLRLINKNVRRGGADGGADGDGEFTWPQWADNMTKAEFLQSTDPNCCGAEKGDGEFTTCYRLPPLCPHTVINAGAASITNIDCLLATLITPVQKIVILLLFFCTGSKQSTFIIPDSNRYVSKICVYIGLLPKEHPNFTFLVLGIKVTYSRPDPNMEIIEKSWGCSSVDKNLWTVGVMPTGCMEEMCLDLRLNQVRYQAGVMLSRRYNRWTHEFSLPAQFIGIGFTCMYI